MPNFSRGEKMAEIVERQGVKYVWLVPRKLVAELPNELADDKEFVEKVLRAYYSQVVCNHGWGFTVKHKGWRVRYDLQNTTENKIPRIYEACVEEKPEGRQTTLLAAK